MVKPTLTAVFGSGTTQDATTVTILKANLPGLTASESNTAESLLIGILVKAGETLNSDNRDENIDQVVSIEKASLPDYVSRGTDAYKRDTFTIQLDKVDINLAIDPDDY